MSAGERVRARILELLEGAGATWSEIEHPAVRTAAEAARARALPSVLGAKSILLKTDDRFRLFALPGPARLRSRGLRRELGVRRTRFATPEELERLTGLEPGAVPPFGEPVLPFELAADPSLAGAERIAFTPGIRTASLVVETADWRRIARPRVFPFAG